MNVIVDGLIYQAEPYGGVSRIYNEILPRMGDIDPSLKITIVTDGKLLQPLPAGDTIRHKPLVPVWDFMRPRRLWEPYRSTVRNIVRAAGLQSSKDQIWHSTFYTVPRPWEGLRVVTVYDMIHEFYPDLFGSVSDDRFRQEKKESIGTADAIICISQNTVSDVKRFYGIEHDRVFSVPLAPSPVFRKLETAPGHIPGLPDRPFILYVGSRVHYKNFDILLNAYSKWKRRRDIDLVLVGKALTQQERYTAQERDVEQSIHCLSAVDDSELCRLYNRAEAFVYPSLYEGFGLPVLEAMACGCPVVASSIPTTEEIAGECPFYFSPQNTIEVIGALEKALDGGRISPSIAAGIDRAGEYSWEKTTQATVDIYRNVASGVLMADATV